MRIRYATIFCLGLLTAAQAGAQVVKTDWWEPRIYGGIGGGRSTLENQRFLEFNEGSTAWELFAGLEFNQYLSLEVGRMDGGKPTLTDATTINAIEYQGTHISGIASWPLSDAVSVYGRAGINSWKTSVHQMSGGGQFYPYNGVPATTTGSDPIFGLGFAINIDTGMLRLEYNLSSADAVARTSTVAPITKYQFDNTYIWLSVGWKFGLPWLN